MYKFFGTKWHQQVYKVIPNGALQSYTKVNNNYKPVIKEMFHNINNITKYHR